MSLFYWQVPTGVKCPIPIVGCPIEAGTWDEVATHIAAFYGISSEHVEQLSQTEADSYYSDAGDDGMIPESG